MLAARACATRGARPEAADAAAARGADDDAADGGEARRAVGATFARVEVDDAVAAMERAPKMTYFAGVPAAARGRAPRAPRARGYARGRARALLAPLDLGGETVAGEPATELGAADDVRDALAAALERARGGRRRADLTAPRADAARGAKDAAGDAELEAKLKADDVMKAVAAVSAMRVTAEIQRRVLLLMERNDGAISPDALRAAFADDPEETRAMIDFLIEQLEAGLGPGRAQSGRRRAARSTRCSRCSAAAATTATTMTRAAAAPRRSPSRSRASSTTGTRRG